MDPETRQLGQALRDNAIALRQLSQPCQCLVIGLGVQIGDELDGADTNGGVAEDPQSAACVKLADRVEAGAADIDAERGGGMKPGSPMSRFSR